MALTMPDEQIIQMQALEIVKLKAQLAESQARECRMREALERNHEWHLTQDDCEPYQESELWGINTAALSASAPCPHAGEVDRPFIVKGFSRAPDGGWTVIGRTLGVELEPDCEIPPELTPNEAAVRIGELDTQVAEVERLKKLCGEAAKFHFHHLDACESNKSTYGNRCNCGAETIVTRLQAAAEGRKG